MRVLVTGGAGFIGSHLVDRLVADGHDVRVLDSLDAQVHVGWPQYLNSEVEAIQADVRDADAVGRALRQVDRIVHFAAAVGVGQSMYDIVRYTSTNAVGAAVVLEQALARRAELEKVVVASSMSIYGEGLYRCTTEDAVRSTEPRSAEQLARREWEPRCPSCGSELEAVPTHESKALQPSSIYAIGKRDHEEMFLVWGHAYAIPATALRFFNVYGRRQALSNPYTGVAAIFASRLLNNRPPVIFEDGHQTRDFIHVSDVVEGVIRALEPGTGDGRAVNVGTGTPTSVARVAEVLAEHLGVDVAPDLRRQFRAGDIRHCFADTTLARDALAFEARVSFVDGMADLVEWLREQEAVDRVDEATAALVEHGLTT